jgi:hypothetical protein
MLKQSQLLLVQPPMMWCQACLPLSWQISDAFGRVLSCFGFKYQYAIFEIKQHCNDSNRQKNR